MSVASNVILGRSSSHFTRTTRIFAAELGVPYSFQIVRDLLSTDSNDYGGNPALKLPTLKTSAGAWFGALNICRELARQSGNKARIIWPEDLATPLAANTHELVVHAMSTEVNLIMNKVAGGDATSTHQQKMMASLTQTISWLEGNVESTLRNLPSPRDLSYLEVTLFCLVEHLEFREVLPMRNYPALRASAQLFGERVSAQGTTYRFDS
jgi:glutathione S-transferase